MYNLLSTTNDKIICIYLGFHFSFYSFLYDCLLLTNTRMDRRLVLNGCTLKMGTILMQFLRCSFFKLCLPGRRRNASPVAYMQQFCNISNHKLSGTTRNLSWWCSHFWARAPFPPFPLFLSFHIF